MKRRVLVLAGMSLLVLAGCTTADDLLKKDPVFFGHTTHTPEIYSTCVADAWRRQGGTIKVNTLENGFDVVKSDVMGMSAALRVQKWADGSVEVRMSARSSFYTQDMVQAANLCM